MNAVDRRPAAWAAIGLVLVPLLSLPGTADRLTWLLEVAPALIAAPVVWVLGRRHGLTPLLAILIVIHAAILAIGAHWTYALVPLGQWPVDWGWCSRNHYDKLGHFAQGFVPAIVLREILRRRGLARPDGGLTPTVIVLACLGISALYEVIEMAAALSLGQAADDFLGTQGWVWDTQTDMLMCGIGALVAVLALRRVHERQLAGLRPDGG
jgi:putative membrane protein